MGSLSKSFALILILSISIQGLGLAMVKTVSAQSTPTPAVPTFTVQLVGPPTLVNTTYSLDPNTGQIVAKIGYTNEYSAVNITIKNQVFSNLSAPNTFSYNVRIKLDNSTNDWSNLWSANSYYHYPTQSDLKYTVLSINLVGSNGALTYVMAPDIPVGAKVDIQVQAMIGYLVPAPSSGNLPSELAEFYGNTSAWSNTQIVNIPANVPLSPTPAPSSSTQTPTSTPSPTSTPIPVGSASNTLLLLTVTIAIVVIAFLLAVIIFLLIHMRKQGRLIGVNLKGYVSISYE